MGLQSPLRRPVNQVDARGANEAGHELVGRSVVKLQWRAELLDPALVEDGDAVTHRHRLHLVVGDVDHRCAKRFVQSRQLDPHVHPQRGVKVGQRLIEQKHLGLAHNRPPYRHPLALPT